MEPRAPISGFFCPPICSLVSVIVSLHKDVSRLCSVIPLWQALYFETNNYTNQHYLFSLVAFIPEVVSVVDFVLIFGVILLVKGLE